MNSRIGPRVGRRMRAASIVGEAVRNLASGTTRATLLAAAFVLIVGGLAVADVRGVVGVLNDARTFRTSGGATQVLKGGDIDGARCAALNGAPGITAAGALRPGAPVHAFAMPSAQLTTWEVTDGVVGLLAQVALPAASNPAAAGGVWVSADLAETLGLRPGSKLATDVGIATVAGVFTWPDDGRARDLGYTMLTPVPAVGTFAQCWAQVWPVDQDVAGLVYTSLIPGDKAGNATFGQLNASRGAMFDARGLLTDRVTARAPLAAAFVGLILGLAAARARRLEAASALHARVRRPHLLWQHLLEAAAWVLAAALIAAAGLAFAAAYGNPDPLPITWLIGLRTVVAGAAAVLLGTLAGTLATREKHLFRYAKDR